VYLPSPYHPEKPIFYLPLLVYAEVRYFFVFIPREFKNEFLKAEKAFFILKDDFLKNVFLNSLFF
jgi:hypothetical protein